MKKRDIRFASIPSTEEVAAERERLAYQNRYQRVLRSTVYILVVVAAAAVLLATLFLPVLQVSGDSINPTLKDKEDRKSTRLNSSHGEQSRMPSSA